MKRIKGKSKTGGPLYSFVMSERTFTALADENAGLCLGCGENADNCEPDARRYTCEACQAPRVYGLEELLMMGRIRFSGARVDA